MDFKNLKTKIELLPKKAGIYLFKNKNGEVIYIGKAHSLKERVTSYFHEPADTRVKNIVNETHDLEFILTETEREASLLENNLIQKYQPKFNFRLKDDKSFPFIKLTLNERFPGVYLARRIEKEGGKFYGPFVPAHQARKTIHLLNKYFGIRSCQEPIPGKRKRPCLEFDMGLCSAPCVEKISEKDYRERIENALLFLEGKVTKLLTIMEGKMREASDKQEFEQAAYWRDLIRAVEQLKERPKFISVHLEDKDIFGYSSLQEEAALFVFKMRKGKVIESKGIFLEKGGQLTPSKILHQQLRKFYLEKNEVPDEIYLPFYPDKMNELQHELRKIKRKDIKMDVPSKGKNLELVKLASRNAASLIENKSLEFNPLERIKKLLNLPKLPCRIEAFDISTTGGDESVGSLVVFEDMKPKKEEYRKYKVKQVKLADDISSLKEVIRRRYLRLQKEGKALPDLILVDGGKGQLNAAGKALKEVGAEGIAVVSLAKKEEILFTFSHKRGIRLERTSPALKLFQNIRDEAHRFALSFHRKRREKKSFSSLLDGIHGIGKKKKLKLLDEFTGLDEIKRASLEELKMIIGQKAALELKKKLNQIASAGK